MKKLIKNLKSHFFKKTVKDQRGQGMMEYILLLVIVVGLVFVFKGQLKTQFDSVMANIQGSVGNVLQNP